MSSPRPIPYRFETERLVLRCWRPGDASLLKVAVDASLEHLRPWMPWAHQEPTSLEVKRQYCRTQRGKYDLDSDYVLGIWNADESKVLGGSGFHTRQGPGALEIGYWIHADHCGQGYATEVTRTLAHAALHFWEIDRVELHCDPANLASDAIPRKLGFTLEATRRGVSEDSDGNPRDTKIWTLLRAELAESPCGSAAYQAFDAVGTPLPCMRSSREAM